MYKHLFIKACLLSLLWIAPPSVWAQETAKIRAYERETGYGSPHDTLLPLWVRRMYSDTPNVFEIEALYRAYYETNKFEKTPHTQYYKRWRRQIAPFVDAKGWIVTPTKNHVDSLRNRALAARQQAPTSGNWTCIGPFDFDLGAAGQSHAPGAAHVYTLEKAPSNPDIFYCGTATAGVWKTIDHGLNWICVTATLPFNYCNAVEIHPSDPNIVWIGANDRLYKTTDGGASWNEVGDANFRAAAHDIDDIALMPSDPNILFVCSDKGLYRSTNGGTSFTRILPNQSSDAYFSEIEFKPDDPNTIYIVQSSVANKYTEFYKSTDGGLTFSLMAGWPVINTASSQTYQYVNRAAATNGHISFANDNLGTAATPDFTIEMRIRVPSTLYDKAILSNKHWSSGSNNGWVIAGRYTGELTFNAGTGAARIDLNTGGVWDNQWHHIAVVYRANGTKELYKDGSLAASSSTQMTMTNTGLPMVFGKDGNLNYGGFDIDVDDIRIWNTALSATNLAAWRNQDLSNSHPNYANLLHYYKCNSLNSNTLTDENGTSNGTATALSAATTQSFTSTTNLGTNDEQKRAEISVTAAAPNRVYALLSGKINGGEGLFGVYVSDDAGQSWTHKCCGSGPGGTAIAAPNGITTPATNANMLGYSETGSSEGGQYYYDLAMEADPNNANKVHIAGINHWYSEDGGTTFNLTAKWSWPDDPEYVHADIHGIHIYGNEVWINNDGGIFLSTDSGKINFRPRQYGIAGTDFWGFGMGHKEADVMLGGTYHNSHLMKNNGVYQNGWVSYTGSADGTRGFVNPVKTNTVYNDGGRDVLPNSRTQNPVSYSFSKLPNTDPTSEIAWDPRCYNCLYSGNGTGLWYSEDDGTTWALVKDFSPMNVADIEIGWDDPNVIWVSTALPSSNGNYTQTKAVWKTTNRGVSWTNMTANLGNLGFHSSMWLEIALGDNNQDVWIAATHRYGWYSNYTHKIFYSNNGGSSWTDWTTPLVANEAAEQIMYQRGSNGGLYLGTRSTVFYRHKNMGDWVSFNAGLPASISTTQLLPWYKEGKIRLASNRSVWESNFYDNSAPMAQPMVDKFTSTCTRDTFFFADYSAHKAGAAFSWSFSPTPQYVSSTTTENPKVVFGAPGNYSVTLTVTDTYGTSTKTVQNMVSLPNASECDPSPIIGQAMATTSNGDYLLSPAFSLNKDNGSANNEVTLMAWIRPTTGTQSSYAAILSCSGVNVNLNLRNNNELGLHWNDSEWWWSSGLTVPANQWSHVALVADGSNLKLYLNGVLANNTTDPVALDLANRQWYVGCDRGNSSRTFKGMIDEVAFYNRALSQNELREQMHLIKSPTADASLKAYFQFNETTGAVWNKSALGSSSFNGGATRTTSTAPVAIGSSQRMSIASGGFKDFSAQHLGLTFPNTGTLPNGEIVVFELTAAPDQLPSPSTALSDKYWVVQNYGSNGSFSALEALAFSGLNGFANGSAAGFKLYKRAATADGATWGTPTATGTQVANNSSVTFGAGNNTTGFGQFALANEMVLSVEWLDFQAVLDKDKVALSWQVASDKTIDFYTIERSADGILFEKLAQAEATDRQAFDRQPRQGVQYYRLTAVEKSGKKTVSALKSVRIEAAALSDCMVFPNPANEVLNIQFSTESPQPVSLSLFDAVGRLVHQYQYEPKLGLNHWLLQTRAFPQGHYVLKIQQGTHISTQKVVF